MHTCEHIVNRTMVNIFGCGRAVSAHIERKKSKLDFALPKAPSVEDIENIEKTVNEVIARHLPVTTEFITQEEAVGRFDLKRLPDNASDTVRIVRVGDYDECLCIGLHVTNTSEIGTFHIISSTTMISTRMTTIAPDIKYKTLCSFSDGSCCLLMLRVSLLPSYHNNCHNSCHNSHHNSCSSSS